MPRIAQKEGSAAERSKSYDKFQKTNSLVASTPIQSKQKIVERNSMERLRKAQKFLSPIDGSEVRLSKTRNLLMGTSSQEMNLLHKNTQHRSYQEIKHHITDEKLQALYKDHNTKCVYCLQILNAPILLDCGHWVCKRCFKQLIIIHSAKFLKKSRKSMKCPQCFRTTFISRNDQISNNRFDMNFHRYIIENIKDERPTVSKVLIKCEQCWDHHQQYAYFQCINCKICLCRTCKLKYIIYIYKYIYIYIFSHSEKFPEHAFAEVNLNACHQHGLKIENFCRNCEEFICHKCGHIGHNVEQLDEAIEQIQRNISESENYMSARNDQMGTALQFIAEFKEKMASSKNYFLSQLNDIATQLKQIIEERKESLRFEILTMFEKHVKQFELYEQAFQALRERYSYIRQQLEPDTYTKTLQIQKLWQMLATNMKEIKTQISNRTDLSNSIFQNIPIEDIKNSMREFRFSGLKLKNYESRKELFKESKILRSKIWNGNIYHVLPDISSAHLLYRLSDHGKGSNIFHDICDNHGPTITLISANQGYIFGSYVDIDWTSEYAYSPSKDAFLFSLDVPKSVKEAEKHSEGKYLQKRKAFRCNIRPERTDKAIRQVGHNFSPAYGESDSLVCKSDLFISFKEPNRSYSHVGNVFNLPYPWKGEEVLAGKFNQWDVSQIEVWAVKPYIPGGVEKAPLFPVRETKSEQNT